MLVLNYSQLSAAGNRHHFQLQQPWLESSGRYLYSQRMGAWFKITRRILQIISKQIFLALDSVEIDSIFLNLYCFFVEVLTIIFLSLFILILSTCVECHMPTLCNIAIQYIFWSIYDPKYDTIYNSLYNLFLFIFTVAKQISNYKSSRFFACLFC